MLYVPSQKSPPQNGHKWELKDGRKEWVGEGGGEESSLATQWQGDVPGATLLCPAEFIAAVKNCGEVACGRGVKVPIGHGQARHCCVAGHCGKVSA